MGVRGKSDYVISIADTAVLFFFIETLQGFEVSKIEKHLNFILRGRKKLHHRMPQGNLRKKVTSTLHSRSPYHKVINQSR